MGGTRAFKQVNLTLSDRVLPACREFEFRSRDYWRCYIKQQSIPSFTFVGTCRMGSVRGQRHVVDADLK